MKMFDKAEMMTALLVIKRFRNLSLESCEDNMYAERLTSQKAYGHYLYHLAGVL